MRASVALVTAGLALVGARLAREGAASTESEDAVARPFAPSAAAAPIVTLGYRELLADVWFVRMLGYYGSTDNEAGAIAQLSEAIAAVDPMFKRNYDVGPIAMTSAKRGVDNAIFLRAVALLERGAEAFPTAWRYPNLAGQIYLVDLVTTDPVQRRAWDERGALLLETASRKPGTPAHAGLQAAILRTRFGQQQRAIENLRELLLITDDEKTKQHLVTKLAELTNDNADEIAAELAEQRRLFEREWKTRREAVPATFYILLGPQLGTTFDLANLATGGRDIIGSEGFERLEPLTPSTDPPPTSPSADDPSNP